MVKKRFWLGMLVLTLVFGMTFLLGCEDDPEPEKKTDAERPSITVAPLKGVYLPGAAVTPLSVTASASDGGALSYQWYSETTLFSSNPTAITGATNTTYSPPTTTAGTLYYYAEVTNTNNSVNGTKTAVQTSSRVKFVVGWESVDVLDIELPVVNGILYSFSPKSIIFANNRFVAVGGYTASGGQIGWSDDGIKWTVVQNTTFGTSVINGIAYGNNRFIAVGDGGKMASSTDGKTWTSVDASSVFGTSNINDIAYGNTRFFAVGDGTKSAYLVDSSSTWTLINQATSNTIFGSDKSILRIVYGTDRFITFASSTNAQCPMYRNNIETSNWQGQPISSYGWSGTATVSDLVSAGNYIVAVGTGGNAWKLVTGSTNIAWTDISPSSVLGTNIITKAAYGSGKLLVFSSNKGAWSSDNGTTWTEVPYINMSRMAYGAGRFVAVSGGSGISYSTYP